MHPLIRSWRIRRAALRDATQGVDSVEEHIVATLKLRPALSVVDNQRHAQALAGQKKRSELNEVRSDLMAAEEEARRHRSPLLLKLGVVGAFGAELLGSVWILNEFGLGSIERAVLGAALAAGLIGLTAQLAESVPSGAGLPPDPSRRSRFRRFLLLYTVVIAALAIARLEGRSDELTRAGAFSQAVLMVLVSIGPAWAAERLIAKLRPAELALARWQLLKRRERILERHVFRAERFASQMSDATQAWDEQAAQLRAEYRLTHRLASASPSEPSEEDSPAEPAEESTELVPTKRRIS